jgi:type IV secretory pathway VirD2 relaxase
VAVQHYKDSDLVPSKHTSWRQTKQTGHLLHNILHRHNQQEVRELQSIISLTAEFCM